MSRRRALLVFIDGVGIGDADLRVNPFFRVPNEFFQGLSRTGHVALPFGGIAVPLDAALGVPGIPQSATGQTSLFTGRNAQAAIGGHLSGGPGESLRKIIHEGNLLKNLHEAGLKVTFANAYQDVFFESGFSRRESVTTTMVRAAGIPFHRVSEILEGTAVYQDFTHAYLQSLDYDIPLFSPERSGEQLARIAAGHDLTVFEYFMTDLVGHSMDMAAAEAEVAKITAFLRAILQASDLSSTSVLIASDHGNLEHMGQSIHTMNPVPGMFWGPLAEAAASVLTAIDQVTPFLERNLIGPAIG